MGHHQLDSLDEQILRLIAGNARIPFLEVARACNVSGAAIHQRIQKLTNLGVLKGSEFIIDPEKVGYETCAYIGIYLKDPASFDAVTKALEAIPEIVECHFTTGKYDMFCSVSSMTSSNPWDWRGQRRSSLSTKPLNGRCRYCRWRRKRKKVTRRAGRINAARNPQKRRGRDVSRRQDGRPCFFRATLSGRWGGTRRRPPELRRLFPSGKARRPREVLGGRGSPRR